VLYVFLQEDNLSFVSGEVELVVIDTETRREDTRASETRASTDARSMRA
jgi:hypothetical protein